MRWFYNMDPWRFICRHQKYSTEKNSKHFRSRTRSFLETENLHLQKIRRDRNFVAIFLPGINRVKKTEKHDTIWAALPCLPEFGLICRFGDSCRLLCCQSSCQTGPVAAASVCRIKGIGGGSRAGAPNYSTVGSGFESHWMLLFSIYYLKHLGLLATMLNFGAWMFQISRA